MGGGQLFSVSVSRSHRPAEDARMLTAGEQDHGMTPANEIRKPPFFSYVFGLPFGVRGPKCHHFVPMLFPIPKAQTYI